MLFVLIELYSNFDNFVAFFIHHRTRRANNGMFEEVKSGNFERECVEETCHREELREVYPDDSIKQNQAWQSLTQKCIQRETSENSGCAARGTETCVQYWNKRNCVCKSGWKGEICELDIDECQLETPVCGKNAICVNLNGGHECQCEIGLEMFVNDEGLTDCRDVDVCRGQCEELGQICVASTGGFHCECDIGYICTENCDSLNSTRNEICDDANECAAISFDSRSD